MQAEVSHLEALQVCQSVVEELLDSLPLADGEDGSILLESHQMEGSMESRPTTTESLELDLEAEELKQEQPDSTETRSGGPCDYGDDDGGIPKEDGGMNEMEGGVEKCDVQPASDTERQLDKEARLQILLKLFQLGCAMVRLQVQLLMELGTLNSG